MLSNCRLCNSSNQSELINLGALPIAHHLLSSPEEKFETYPLVLSHCSRCGLIQIENPIAPEILYLNYNYCFSSWKSQPHAVDEIKTISHFTQRRSIIEIGCNDGYFLHLLEQHGWDQVVGLEPNPYAADIAKQKRLNIHIEMLNKRICKTIIEKSGKFEVIVARQVIEHLTDLINLFSCVDILISEKGYLFLDFPDFETALVMGDCSMIWEEHVNYFTEETVRTMLSFYGYDIVSLKRYSFSGGSIAILAKRSANSHKQWSNAAPNLSINSFAEKVNSYGACLNQALNQYRSLNFQIILYGVGCRACTFVNNFTLNQAVDFAIDDQPERQGKYMPGSKICIRSPQILAESDSPVLCLLAVNNECESLVKEKLKNITSRPIITFSVFSPGDIWRDMKSVIQQIPDNRCLKTPLISSKDIEGLQC